MAALRHFCKHLLTKPVTTEFHTTSNYTLCNRFASYTAKEYSQDKDPALLFFNKDVQSLLKSVTRVDLNKVYRKRKLGDTRLEIPTYKFLTEDQLQEVISGARRKAEDFLQIPPVVKVRKQIDNVLSHDVALQSLDTARFVFTDITFGIRDSERFIVVREPDGTLRDADWSLRDRMNMVYFPMAGRKQKRPLMFEDSYLKKLFAKNEFVFILDRACLQFEPDDEEYQRVTSLTYQCINENNGFGHLRSTRHFGSMAFFLAWFNMIDNLLLDLIQTSYIDEANLLLQLYGKIHDIEFHMMDIHDLRVIERYIKEFSHKRAPLELTMQAYKDLEKERNNLDQGIQKAHGLG